MTYQWTIISQAVLIHAESLRPSLRVDEIGLYVVQLIVNDGQLSSEPVTITLTAEPVASLAITIGSPADNAYTNRPSQTIAGLLNHRAELSVKGDPAAIASDLNFTHPVQLAECANSFTLTATAGLRINPNNLGLGFHSAQVTISTANGVRDVIAADMDGDDDLDLVSASGDGRVAWYPKTGVIGEFGEQRLIASQASYVNAIFTADVDGDRYQDLDVITGISARNTVSLEINIDGLGTFYSGSFKSRKASAVLDIDAGDLDNDGYIDILAATYGVTWYKNRDGTRFSKISKIIAKDIDNDGDLSIIYCASGRDQLAWHSNFLIDN